MAKHRNVAFSPFNFHCILLIKKQSCHWRRSFRREKKGKTFYQLIYRTIKFLLKCPHQHWNNTDHFKCIWWKKIQDNPCLILLNRWIVIEATKKMKPFNISYEKFIGCFSDEKQVGRLAIYLGVLNWLTRRKKISLKIFHFHIEQKKK